ncbi:MAG: nucleoside triphosphate pyrophosphohydrolase [bacterium]|nr:nucleoside triphosphate pyrophosphohydrolase [bacterium]MDT8364882.1 nucleoside triphosphate pyrophosphohydrolase [bacterium]
MTVTKRPIDELLEIMTILRGPEGCPWDKGQTHESLKPYVVEEAYELVEAVEGGQNGEIKEELGDLLLQIIFHSQIAAEAGRFDFDDVVQGIIEKLLRRHPHVFGGERAANEAEALHNWERIKAETEGKKKTKRHPGTPILHRALRMQEKAVSFGFDWEETSQLFEKLEEEITEVQEAVASGNREEITEEIGDLLFMAVNLSRYLDIHPEDALERSMNKFTKRFRSMEEMAALDNRPLEDMELGEMEKYWERAKIQNAGRRTQNTE